MATYKQWVLWLAIVTALAVGSVGCGGSDDEPGDDGSGGGTPTSAGSGSGEPGSGGGTPGTPTANVDFGALTVVPTPMYSGYDGENTFSLPAYVLSVSTEVEDWSAEPADAVSLSPWQSDDGSQVGVLITVTAPVDEVEISVVRGSIGGRSTLFVSQFTPAQTAAGRDRYTMGQSFDLDAFIAMMGSGGSATIPDDLRCDTCHSSTAENLQVMNTPTQTSLYSDEELRAIFLQGTKPAAVGFRVLPSFIQPFYAQFHAWNASEEEIGGLISYLRSLAPMGQGEIVRPDVTGGIMIPPFCMPQAAEFDANMCGDWIAMQMGGGTGGMGGGTDGMGDAGTGMADAGMADGT